MEVTNHSCLICSTSFGKWRKTREEMEGGDSSELVFRFRRAFTIFCSLISVDLQDNPEDQFETLRKLALDHSDDSNFETGFVKNGNRSPCCEKCFKMFEEILLLQKAIEESKIAQTKLARNLKRSLLKSTDNRSDRFVEDVWTKIRLQLICYLKKDDGASSIEMGEVEHEVNLESEAEFSPVNESNEEESCMEIEANMNSNVDKRGRVDVRCAKICHSEVSTHIAQQVKLREERVLMSKGDLRTLRNRKMEVGRKPVQKTLALRSELTRMRPCSVVIKRLSKSDIASFKSLTQPPGKNVEVSSKVRKSKKKAFDFIRKSVALKGHQNEVEEASHSRKKKVLPKQPDLDKMDKNKIQVACDNLSDDEYLPDMVNAESNDESNSETEKGSEHPKHCTREERSIISDGETLSITNKVKNAELVGKKRQTRAHRSFKRDAQDMGIKTLNTNGKCSDGEYTPDHNVMEINTDNDHFRCKNGPVKSENLSKEGTESGCTDGADDCFNDGLEDAETAFGMEEDMKISIGSPRRKRLDVSERNSETSRGQTKRRRNRYGRFFYAVNKSTLICKCTCVTFSQEGLKCEEPGCTECFEETDFQAFNNMFHHIVESHEVDYSTKREVRKCPICSREFKDALHFRYHVLHEHGDKKTLRAVCEVCQRTVLPVLVKKHMLAFHKEEAKVYCQKPVVKKIMERIKDLKTSLASEDREGSPTGRNYLDLGEGNHVLETRRRNNYGRLFYAVNKSTLLCKCTCVTFSSESLKCEEPGCTECFEGTDFQAFNNMFHHIVESHEVGYSTKREVRKCSICSREFKNAVLFRNHVLHDHKDKKTVRAVCEVCHKQLLPAFVRKHMVAFHKDEAKVYCQKPGVKTLLERIKDLGTSLPSEDREVFKRSHERIKLCQKSNSEENVDPTSTKKLKRGSLDDEAFYRVSDSWMMYKSTPILCSWTHFTCREEACNEVIIGTDYFAFEELRRHVNDVHLKDTFDYEESKRSCVECSQTFQNGYSFRYHIMRKHNYKTCICTSCFKTLNLSSLQRHQWSHKSAEEKAAAIAAGFTDPLELEKRRCRKSESFKGKIECTECGKQFSNMINLRAHKITHLPKSLRETFKCPEENCEVVLLSKPALRSHIERRHRPELASRHRVCQICNARFHFRDGHHYRAHMLSHKNEYPFVCEICGKGFVAKSRLERHGRAHSDERMFQCEYCIMSYKCRDGLRRHRLGAHKDLVPIPSAEERLKQTTVLAYRPDFIGPRIAYPCEYCEKVFQLRSRMTKHLRICAKRRVEGAQK